MKELGGCLRLLYSGYFMWVHLVATFNARSLGRQCAVPGPEAADLIPLLSGCLVMTAPGGGMRAITLPTHVEKNLREPSSSDREPGPVVLAVAGPDSRGRVAYVENWMSVPPGRSQNCLRVIDETRGQDQILLSRRGDALWGTAFGDDLALSRIGGKIAFLSHLTQVQMLRPSALLHTGTIEIWSVDQGTGGETGVTALDDRLSWFPDGRHLAYVALMPKEQVFPEPLEPERFGQGTLEWPQVPVVRILDTETTETEFLHLGRSPVVSTDGKSVLVADFAYRWHLVDMTTHQSKPVQTPGQWGAPLALIDSRFVLYRGYPTAGTPIRLTESNSPLSGPKLMLSVKVADLETRRFQTIVSYFDPRTRASCGLAIH
jgi:hypothetical protein